MSIFQNVTVYSGDRVIATDVTADIIDDSQNALVWGGHWEHKPIEEQDYRLSSGGLLDWTGTLTGGRGTEASPYTFKVTDSEQERRAKRHSAC